MFPVFNWIEIHLFARLYIYWSKIQLHWKTMQNKNIIKLSNKQLNKNNKDINTSYGYGI